ncbi:MAG: glycosyltransferase family 87 protein [Candidatus Kryptoniota bacterium]
MSNRIFSLSVSTPSCFILDVLIAVPPAAISKFLLTAISLVAMVPLVHGSAKLANSSVRTAYLVFLSSSFALATNFSSSEPFIILALFFVTAFFTFSTKAERAAGVILGIAFPFNVFFAIPAMLFLLSKKWHVFIYFVLSSLLVVVITYVVVGESAIIYYLERVFPSFINGRVQNPFSISYQTAWSFLRRLFVSDPTLNSNPIFASRDAYVFSISLFKSLTVVPAAYFFYRGIEKNNPREAFVASTFPVMFLSPTATTFQLVLLAPAIICLSQTALEEHRISIARLFIVLYAMVCIPFFVGLSNFFKIQTPILLYERFFLLFSIYVLYLFFQLRTLSKHLFAWRMSITAATIAAITVPLYFGDNTPSAMSQFPAKPILKGEQLKTAAFSPASYGDRFMYVGVDSNSRNYAVQNEVNVPHESRNCYRVSASADGLEFMIETTSPQPEPLIAQKPSVYFGTKNGDISYLAESGSVSRDGDFGAFIRSGSLYIVEMRSKHIPVIDSLVISPFKIIQCNFNNGDNSKIALIIDSLNGAHSVGMYNLQTHRLITYYSPFPLSSICANEENIYGTYEDNDSTSVWLQQAADPASVGADSLIKLFAVHGNVIDINVVNHDLYFSSDFERGLGLPTIYKYPLYN